MRCLRSAKCSLAFASSMLLFLWFKVCFRFIWAELSLVNAIMQLFLASSIRGSVSFVMLLHVCKQSFLYFLHSIHVKITVFNVVSSTFGWWLGSSYMQPGINCFAPLWNTESTVRIEIIITIEDPFNHLLSYVSHQCTFLIVCVCRWLHTQLWLSDKAVS